MQQKRVNAAQAFIRADSDAKLRRAFTQKFVENRDEVVVGQGCWYWRDAGAGILRKARWRGPARVVAVEPVGDSKVLWLCHGTSLVRCGPRQVRPVVEETGVAVPADRAAAMRDLEELKARSTTQFKDALKRAGGNPDVDELMGDENEIEAEYEPSNLPHDAETSDESPQGSRPGVVQMFFPQPPQQQQHDDGSERGRERSPRRRLASDASTTLPMAWFWNDLQLKNELSAVHQNAKNMQHFLKKKVTRNLEVMWPDLLLQPQLRLPTQQSLKQL